MNARRSSNATPLACGLLLATFWLSLGATGCSRRHDSPSAVSPVQGRDCFALGQKNLLGFMDTAGRLVTKPVYVTCEMDGWRGGHLWVMTGDGDYSGTFIRGDGTPISPPKFGVLQILCPGLNNPYFFRGVACVVLEGEKSAYIDASGTILCEGVRGGPDKEGLISVSSGGKFGYADVKGKIVIPHQFDYAEGFAMGMAQVKIDGKYCVIRRDGTFMGGDGYEFVKIASRSKRTFWVGVNGRIGLADEAGRLISDALFDEILDMDDINAHSAFVRETDGLWGFLDKGGAFLTPPSFAKVEHFGVVEPFTSAYARVTGEGGGIGLIDRAGVLHAPGSIPNL